MEARRGKSAAMAQRKRTPKAPPAEVEKVAPTPPAPATGPRMETVCVTMDPHQIERLGVLCAREPRDWGRSQWVRHAMAAHEQLDEVAGGVIRKPVKLAPEALSTDEKLTTETSKLRARR